MSVSTTVVSTRSLPAADDLLLLRDRHHPLVDLLDDLRAQRDAELAQGLGVGDLVARRLE